MNVVNGIFLIFISSILERKVQYNHIKNISSNIKVSHPTSLAKNSGK